MPGDTKGIYYRLGVIHSWFRVNILWGIKCIYLHELRKEIRLCSDEMFTLPASALSRWKFGSCQCFKLRKVNMEIPWENFAVFNWRTQYTS